MDHLQTTFIHSPLPTLTISVKKSSLFSRIILAIFIILFFTAPLLTSGFIIYSGQNLKFAIIIFYLIFGLCGIFFLRLFLWNTGGREIITFEKEKVNYFADYKYFKDRKISIASDALSIDIVETDINDEKEGRLKICNRTEVIETVIRVPLAELTDKINNSGLSVFKL